MTLPLRHHPQDRDAAMVDRIRARLPATTDELARALGVDPAQMAAWCARLHDRCIIRRSGRTWL